MPLAELRRKRELNSEAYASKSDALPRANRKLHILILRQSKSF